MDLIFTNEALFDFSLFVNIMNVSVYRLNNLRPFQITSQHQQLYESCCPPYFLINVLIMLTAPPR